MQDDTISYIFQSSPTFSVIYENVDCNKSQFPIEKTTVSVAMMMINFY